MARKALIYKANQKPKYSSRTIRRCLICGRNRSVLRYFKLCRLCFREKASEGKVPGIVKSSW